jgi:hypothetical protein
MGSVDSDTPAEQPAAVPTALRHLTGDVRRILKPTENEPVGVLTAYRDATLKLADAIDRLADEIDSRTRDR